MSFDLFLHRFQHGDSFPADRNAVLEVLRSYTNAEVDQFGFYLVDFEDGSCLELSSKQLQSDEVFSDCAFHLRDFSSAVIRFVYEVATAGDFVIVNAQSDGSDENPMAVLVTEAQREHLPEGLDENPKVALSYQGLAEALGANIESWQTYRNHVVNGDASEP